MKTASVRLDAKTGQFVPQVNGVDVSPTAFTESRALEIAQQAAAHPSKEGERITELETINADLIYALEHLQKQLRAHFKLDVKKHYSLMVADAAAGKALFKAKGAPAEVSA